MSNRRKPTDPQPPVERDDWTPYELAADAAGVELLDDDEPIPVEPEAPAELFTVGRGEFDEVLAVGGVDAARVHLSELVEQHGTIRVSESVLFGEDEHGERELAVWVPADLTITTPDEHGSVYVTTSQEKTA